MQLLNFVKLLGQGQDGEVKLVQNECDELYAMKINRNAIPEQIL